MTAPRAILFDKDGTLFDYHASWSQFTTSLIGDFSNGDPVLAEVLAEAVGFEASLSAVGTACQLQNDPAQPDSASAIAV